MLSNPSFPTLVASCKRADSQSVGQCLHLLLARFGQFCLHIQPFQYLTQNYRNLKPQQGQP